MYTIEYPINSVSQYIHSFIHLSFVSGLGWCSATIVFFVNCYYQVILAWAFYYMFASFTTELPWNSCDNYWNTENCIEDHMLVNGTNLTLTVNGTSLTGNGTAGNGTAGNGTLRIGAVTEFWE